jgi:thiazole/oxazole-forming peptide maturase SagD family component
MNVKPREVFRGRESGLDRKVLAYADRSISPLLGLIRRVALVTYDAKSPTIFTVLPELADIHRRAGITAKPEYHVGGFGFSLEEAMMRALGESAERVAHVTFHVRNPHLLVKRSRKELQADKISYLPLADLGRFSQEQREHPAFPFDEFDESAPICWLPAIELTRDAEILVPAQVMLTGFTTADEPRAAPAMTTGTATHVTMGRSLLNALLELLEIDAAMGHWYSGSAAPRIDATRSSTPRLARFLEMAEPWLGRTGSRFEFYWLRSASDLPVYVVACTYRSDSYPALAVGLGAATDLESAMYTALRESIPITAIALLRGLALVNENTRSGETRRLAADLAEAIGNVSTDAITDLETAVAYYAAPGQSEEVFNTRFDSAALVSGQEIQREVITLGNKDDIDSVFVALASEAGRRHRLLAMDLTTEESVGLGFRVTRIYSPDLLPLFLPSFPEIDHPRFRAYGGFRSTAPHPYP